MTFKWEFCCPILTFILSINGRNIFYYYCHSSFANSCFLKLGHQWLTWSNRAELKDKRGCSGLYWLLVHMPYYILEYLVIHSCSLHCSTIIFIQMNLWESLILIRLTLLLVLYLLSTPCTMPCAIQGPHNACSIPTPKDFYI